MKVSDARVVFGFPGEVHQARYSLWRSDVGAYMQTHGIKTQTQAGAERWKGLQDFAMSHRFVECYQERFNGTDSTARRLQDALQAILFDIRGNLTKKRKNAAREDAVLGIPPPSTARSRSAAAAAANSTALSPLASAPFKPIGVLVYLCDPALVPDSPPSIAPKDRQWGTKEFLRYAGMIYEPSMRHLISLALRKVDTDPPRKVRNLFGALDNPVMGLSGSITQNPDSLVLLDDEDVEGWLELTQASPLRLLAILERAPSPAGTAARQTPPPTGYRYIDSEAFETVDEPYDTSEDEEGLATKKRRRPNTRKGYEKRLGRLRRNHERLGAHIEELEGQFRSRFPSSRSRSRSSTLFRNRHESDDVNDDDDDDDDDDDEEGRERTVREESRTLPTETPAPAPQAGESSNAPAGI